MKRERGFSLIELIMLIVLLAILSSVFMQMFARLGGGLKETHDAQIAQAMTQECYTYLLQARREYGYAMNGIANCNLLTSFQSYGVASVSLTASYSDSPCPSGASCKLFTISVPAIAPAYKRLLMLVDY